MNHNGYLPLVDACDSGQALEAKEMRQGPWNSEGFAQQRQQTDPADCDFAE
jgi:hypothetical protein